MERLGKKPAYLYAKDFSLSQVLGNFQAYKIVTGQISDELAQTDGSSKEETYGNLIRNAGWTEVQKSDTRNSTKQVEKTKSNKKYQLGKDKFADVEVIDDEDFTPSRWSTISDARTESLSLKIPESILAYGGDTSDSDENEDTSRINCLNNSASVIVNERQESDDDENQEDKFKNDFFGLERLKQKKTTYKGISTSKRYIPYDASKRRRSNVAKAEQGEASSTSCTNCKRRGHLAIHCTLHTSNGHSTEKGTLISNNLSELFARCRNLKENRSRRCSECGITSNLVHCMECNVILCDGQGHLQRHLLAHPLHRKLYSYKLQRLLKCQNPDCDVTDVYKLFMCRHCLDKSFNQHYSMINATWSKTGLKTIPNSIACDEHFLWHQINCGCNIEETILSREDLEHTAGSLLSEFYF